MAATCLQTARPIAYGAVIAAADVFSAPCPDAAPKVAARYDVALGVARASRALSAGEILPDIPAFALAGVRAGDQLRIEISAGPVKVLRTVEALQPARPGERLFVKGAGGPAFSIPYPENIRD